MTLRTAALTCSTGLVAAACVATGASAAKSQNVDDAAHLHLIASHGGNALIETGKATGTLPGTVTVSLTIHTRTANSSFTIAVKGGGSISGKGAGVLKTGKGGYASFGGSITVTGGTGKYAHASGKGGLYGTIYRLNDSMTVKVTGALHY
ncbi:MAG: hypothetical protein ACYC0H_09935 [Solirubrobacteraceae bacterium]